MENNNVDNNRQNCTFYILLGIAIFLTMLLFGNIMSSYASTVETFDDIDSYQTFYSLDKEMYVWTANYDGVYTTYDYVGASPISIYYYLYNGNLMCMLVDNYNEDSCIRLISSTIDLSIFYESESIYHTTNSFSSSTLDALPTSVGYVDISDLSNDIHYVAFFNVTFSDGAGTVYSASDTCHFFLDLDDVSDPTPTPTDTPTPTPTPVVNSFSLSNAVSMFEGFNYIDVLDGNTYIDNNLAVQINVYDGYVYYTNYTSLGLVWLQDVDGNCTSVESRNYYFFDDGSAYRFVSDNTVDIDDISSCAVSQWFMVFYAAAPSTPTPTPTYIPIYTPTPTPTPIVNPTEPYFYQGNLIMVEDWYVDYITWFGFDAELTYIESNTYFYGGLCYDDIDDGVVSHPYIYNLNTTRNVFYYQFGARVYQLDGDGNVSAELSVHSDMLINANYVSPSEEDAKTLSNSPFIFLQEFDTALFARQITIPLGFTTLHIRPILFVCGCILLGLFLKFLHKLGD